MQPNFLPMCLRKRTHLSPSCFGIVAENQMRISRVSSFNIKVVLL